MDITTNNTANNPIINPGVNETLDRLNQPGTIQNNGQENTLGQSDFLRLLTVQLSQQDPLEPVQNEAMLAQMAQFSSLANTTATNDTLQTIVERLDALIDVQSAPPETATETAPEAIPTT